MATAMATLSDANASVYTDANGVTDGKRYGMYMYLVFGHQWKVQYVRDIHDYQFAKKGISGAHNLHDAYAIQKSLEELEKP
jgi:hypothetical protein